METYREKLLLEEIKFYLPDFDYNNEYEIRCVRVLKHKRKKNVLKNPKLNLIILSNDWIELDENHLVFYTISSTEIKKIIGIEFLYYENGTKEENLILNEKSNSIINLFLKSKYNIKTKNSLEI